MRLCRVRQQESCSLDIMLFTEQVPRVDAIMSSLFPVNALRWAMNGNCPAVGPFAAAGIHARLARYCYRQPRCARPPHRQPMCSLSGWLVCPGRNRALLLVRTSLVLVIDGDLLVQSALRSKLAAAGPAWERMLSEAQVPHTLYTNRTTSQSLCT